MDNWINKHKILSICIAALLAVIVYEIISTWGGKPRYNYEWAMASGKDTTDIGKGRMIAARYCQSCHSLPDPSLLTKEMWYTGVLPRMGPFLGYTHFHGQAYARANDVPASSFPAQPVLDSTDWSYLIKYYISKAPQILPEAKKPVAVARGLPQFDVITPGKDFYGTTEMTSYVKIDTASGSPKVLVADGLSNRFIVLDGKLKQLFAAKTAGPIVDINFNKNETLACSIGLNLEANNQLNGEIRPITIGNDGKMTAAANPLFSKLARPVKITRADLNGDGREDYIISQFGNLVGELSWMENLGNGKYASHTLKQSSGALSTIVWDYNHDGKPDIWAQFAQGREGIFLFTNKGGGQFEEKQVLSFPPSYGSTSFDLVDMNHDGHPDIIYTCGDNGDYTPILKPYHGVYIFLNDGNNNFKQRYFFPINGCYKAIARDFDGDGNIDIATISFYPSDQQPEEAFIYLKNEGDFKFKAYSLPGNIPFQKGITMDSGDIDGDGRPDLILGNGYFNSDSTGKHKEPLFILLKNKK